MQTDVRVNFQTDHAAGYGNTLLSDLGMASRISTSSDHSAISWKRSGLLHTSSHILPLHLTSHVNGALMAIKVLAPKAKLPLNGALLMGERARLRETVRRGRFCAGGYGRLLECMDGRIALNLVREDDWDLIPAWLEADVNDWDGIVRAVAGRKSEDLSERAAEMGIAAAIDKLPPRPRRWFTKTGYTLAPPKSNPLVVDLSGLWAGPLASSLLQSCGARVIKVEGPARPDGMRNGHEGFYKLLNAGKDCAAFDFKSPEDLNSLKALLHAADIVIEASRPRAFEQLGIVADEFMTKKPGKVWARLTAYGRSANRIGFGDDIGVSAGLASVMESAVGEPCFVGDAIADPVNGVHLALAILAHWQSGGGAILDLAMVDVLRFAMGEVPKGLRSVYKEWTAIAAADTAPLYLMRLPVGQTRDLGADTAKILATLC